MIITQIFMSFFPSFFSMAGIAKDLEIIKAIIRVISISSHIVNMIYVQFPRIITKIYKAFLAYIAKVFKNFYSWSTKAFKFKICFGPSPFDSKPNWIFFHFFSISFGRSNPFSSFIHVCNAIITYLMKGGYKYGTSHI